MESQRHRTRVSKDQTHDQGTHQSCERRELPRNEGLNLPPNGHRVHREGGKKQRKLTFFSAISLKLMTREFKGSLAQSKLVTEAMKPGRRAVTGYPPV